MRGDSGIPSTSIYRLARTVTENWKTGEVRRYGERAVRGARALGMSVARGDVAHRSRSIGSGRRQAAEVMGPGVGREWAVGIRNESEQCRRSALATDKSDQELQWERSNPAVTVTSGGSPWS